MASNLDFEGTYDDGLNGRPMRRFVINNWTEEDIHSKWDGQPIIIKKGEMAEFGHAVAYKLTKEIVDREIFKEAAKAGSDKERERKEMSILYPAVRAPYEAKTLLEVKAGEENPVMAKMRAEIRAEEQAKLGSATDAAAGVTNTPKPKARAKKEGEFADVT